MKEVKERFHKINSDKNKRFAQEAERNILISKNGYGGFHTVHKTASFFQVLMRPHIDVTIIHENGESTAYLLNEDMFHNEMKTSQCPSLYFNNPLGNPNNNSYGSQSISEIFQVMFFVDTKQNAHSKQG